MPEPDKLPGCQVRVDGPVAVMETEEPTQMDVALLNVSGALSTFTQTAAAELQLPLLPVTV